MILPPSSHCLNAHSVCLQCVVLHRESDVMGNEMRRDESLEMNIHSSMASSCIVNVKGRERDVRDEVDSEGEEGWAVNQL